MRRKARTGPRGLQSAAQLALHRRARLSHRLRALSVLGRHRWVREGRARDLLELGPGGCAGSEARSWTEGVVGAVELEEAAESVIRDGGEGSMLTPSVRRELLAVDVEPRR